MFATKRNETNARSLDIRILVWHTYNIVQLDLLFVDDHVVKTTSLTSFLCPKV